MTTKDMIEFLDAAHNAVHVEHDLPNRGGIFLCGPPESMKTSVIDCALKPYHDALVISDINVQQLLNMKGDFTNGRYNTLAFREFSKLFERDPRTASSLVGHIRAIADEGFSKPSFEDQRMQSTMARAMILGAMTEDFYHQHFSQWEKSGFIRRFLWMVYRIDNIRKATESILSNKLLALDGIPRFITDKPIPFSLDQSDKTFIQGILKEQRGMTTNILFMSKIFCFLKWKYKDDGMKARVLLNSIRASFSKGGGVLIL